MATGGFNGLTVAAFESRMAADMTRLIERHGGTPLVAPALREIPLGNNSAALQFGEQLMREGLDVLVLMTGAGTTALFELLKTRYTTQDIAAALKDTDLIARGPKPVAALKALGFQPTFTVPEPNTWMDVISTLDASRPVNGLRVAVQEYGVSNRDLLEALKLRGAHVTPVPIYRWALPEDTSPMKEALRRILAGEVQVVLITNAAQFDHMMQLAGQERQTEPFKQACTRLVLASIGPTASERIRSHGLSVDFEPSHGKMGILVKETSAQAQRLLAAKRAS